jgi:hypothetical protein
VRISSPREFGGSFDTKGAIFNTVPTLLEQMADGHLVHLAVVVDSDSPQDGGGQQATLVPRVADSAVISRRIRDSGRDVWSSLNPAISTTRGTRAICDLGR